MLSEVIKLCKRLFAKAVENKKELYLSLIILLVAIISFGLGRLSKIREEKTPITIESINTETSIAVSNALNKNGAGIMLEHNSSTISPSSSKIFVASKNGKKYYYAWCESAKIIKEQNRVWFSTQAEAEKAGYSPAVNCKGLQ